MTGPRNECVTEALKTSNIKTVLFILRTIDKKRRKETVYRTDAFISLAPETSVRTGAARACVAYLGTLGNIVRTVTIRTL